MWNLGAVWRQGTAGGEEMDDTLTGQTLEEVEPEDDVDWRSFVGDEYLVDTPQPHEEHPQEHSLAADQRHVVSNVIHDTLPAVEVTGDQAVLGLQTDIDNEELFFDMDVVVEDLTMSMSSLHTASNTASEPTAFPQENAEPFIGAIINDEARRHAPSLGISVPHEAAPHFDNNEPQTQYPRIRPELAQGLGLISTSLPEFMPTEVRAPSIISADSSYLESGSVDEAVCQTPLTLTPMTSVSGRSKRPRCTSASFECDHADCADSPRKFVNQAAVNHHKRRHTPEADKKHGCENCSRRFLYWKDLDRHQWKHAPSSVECPVCHKLYKRPDHRARHMRRSHSNSIP